MKKSNALVTLAATATAGLIASGCARTSDNGATTQQVVSAPAVGSDIGGHL